jgi:exodeoxyribonuclease VII large subunit
MKSAMLHQIEKLTAKLSEAGRTLNSVSPLATLDRGYSILQTKAEQIVRSSSDVKPGDQITAKLGSGALECTVEKCLDKGQ